MFDVLKLASSASLMRFKPREVIISPNQKSYEYLFVVFSGCVGRFSYYSSGNGEKVCEYIKGDIFGESEFFCGSNDSATYAALDDVTVIAIDKSNFYSLCSTNPESTIEIITYLCERTCNLERNHKRVNTVLSAALAELGRDFDSFSAQSFLPAEHKEVDLAEPENFKNVLAPKELCCPHCNQKFNAFIQLSSKLRPLNNEMRADLRKVYHDFDPIWYDITTCPLCFFSAQTMHFEKPPFLSRAVYSAALEDAKAKVMVDFTYPKTLKQVFTSYYIALICADGFEHTAQIKGRLWLNLSWLYEDLKQDEMLVISRKNSFNSYSSYFSVSDLDAGTSQVCHLLLGFLSGKLEHYDIALDHLYKAKTMPDGKPVYKLIADRENEILREERQRKKQAEAQIRE